MVKTGELDRRITFRQGTQTKNTSGGVSVSYADVFSTWAKVVVMRGEQLDIGTERDIRRPYKITIRTRHDYYPNERWQIVYNGITLKIDSLTEVDKYTIEIVAYELERSETGNNAIDYTP